MLRSVRAAAALLLVGVAVPMAVILLLGVYDLRVLLWAFLVVLFCVSAMAVLMGGVISRW